jgi:cytosine/adenosine deaminase-related metal-dependent hydrolase
MMSTPNDGQQAGLDLAIVNGTVITMDPDRRVLRGAAVGIRDGRIVAVETGAASLPPARETIDATGRIVLPGIVDTHGHAGHSLTRGFGEGSAWMDIVETIYFHASDPWFWEAESRLAALERLRFGITTSVSMTGSSPRVDDAKYAVAASAGYRELGLRHIVAAGPPSGPWPREYTERLPDGGSRSHTVDMDRALAVTEDALQAIRGLGNDRLQFYVGPSSVSPTDDPDDPLSRQQVNGVQDLVEKHDAGLHTHAYAGQIAAAHEIRPDILGPHACIAHCAGISMEEIAILAKTGTAASHGPLTHAYVGARFPVIEALEAGVNVVFSTDGSAPDRSFDLVDQARVGMQLQRVHFNDDQLLPAGKVLGMITIDAARALGMQDEIGSLEVGKRADVTILDARQPHLAPEILAPLRVIGHASGHDVTDVIVDGEVLMRDRVVAGVDQDAILDDAHQALLATWDRTGFGDIEAQHPDTWHGIRYDQ